MYIICKCEFGNMQDASKAVQIVIPYGPCWIIKIQIMFSKLLFNPKANIDKTLNKDKT